MKRQSSTNSSIGGNFRHGGRPARPRQGLRGGRLTKLAGIVASFAPAVSGSAKAFLMSTASLVGVLAGAFLGLTADEARAACIEAPSGTWTCSESTTTAFSVLRSGGIIVNLESDFELNNTSPNIGISVTKLGGAGGISLTQSAGGGNIISRNSTGLSALVINSEGPLSINVNGAVSGLGSVSTGIVAQTLEENSPISLTAATVTGANDGINAFLDRNGGGSLSISVSGTVIGTSNIGIDAQVRHSRYGSMTVTAAAVTGGKVGIRAVASGAGAVSIKAGGAVAGAAEAGVKVNSYARATDMTIDVAAVTGRSGIDARHGGSGKLDIKASGSVTGTGAEGIFGLVSNSNGGRLTITAAVVTGSSYGIRAVSSGTGGVSISTSGTVTGGSAASDAAIKTDASSGTTVTVSLNSGASVGAAGRNAIIDTAGNATVTVNTGASITGKVNLGAGNDTLTFSGGSFAAVTEMDGGAGTDKLEFENVSGVVSGTLENWESINIESGATISFGTGTIFQTGATITVNTGASITGKVNLGAVNDNLTFAGGSFAAVTEMDGGAGINRLAFENVSGVVSATLENWYSIAIKSGATISFGTGVHSATVLFNLYLYGGGTLNIGDDSDTDDELTISGNFSGVAAGEPGIVTLDANFGSANSGSDSLTISGHTAGTTTVNLSRIGSGALTAANSVARIEDVISATGIVAAGAFSVGSISGLQNSVFTYRFELDTVGKSFDLVRVYANACEAATSPSGAFTCSGVAAIGGPQSLSASGATALSVTLNSETRVDAAGTAFTLTQTDGAGGISFTQSATGQSVSGTQSGIVASNSGGGAISINVNGTLTGVAGDGISASSDASGTGITVTAASVSGANSGIKVMATGTGFVSVSASGSVAGGTGDGIFVDHDGTGATSVAVSGSVSGGSGNGVAAIRTDVSSGRAVTVSLASGASVGAAGRNAIVDSGGNAAVTVNTGASIAGKVNLGAGNDTLTFAGGTFSNVTEMKGGAGTDTLTFSGGASGAMSGVAEWETVSIRSGSTVSFGTGAHTLGAGTLTVASGGTLNVGDDLDTGDELTVSGNFAGGGTVVLDANFGSSNSGSDSLAISGNVSGTTTVNLSRIGSGDITTANSAARINGVITATGTVAAGAFSLGTTGIGQSSAFTYEFQFDATNKRFDLVRVSTNACAAVSGTSGAFTCSGANQIGASQSLSASGGTALSVTLNSETPVDTGGTAFALTQTGGAGGISLTQSGSGERIRGAQSGIAATNSGGGAISINVNGTVTGAADHGISAANDGSGSGITITAVSVSGADSGIRAVEDGSGAVRIAATGTVTGALEEGVYAKTASGGAVTLTAAAVTGGKAGIKASAGGSGAVSVRASGTVSATATSGIGIDVSASGGNVSVSAAAVTGSATGIKIAATGTGDVSISASGSVAGGTGDGIFVDHGGTGPTSVAVSGSVSGGSGNGVAAIRTDVSSGRAATVSLNSGALVGSTGRNAIVDTAGNAAVTVNSDASIIGKVNLGAGNDTLTFAGGTFSNVAEMQGGAGTDTLKFSGGSGALHATVQSDGLKGWESVIVESGATLSGNIKLANDSGNLTFNGAALDSSASLDGGGGSANTLSLNNVSDSLDGSKVTGWETIRIGSGASVKFGDGAHTLSATTLEVNANGTLDVGDDSDTGDELTVSGNFAGGGTVILDANFGTVSSGSDSLTISGNATGTTTVNLSRIGTGAITTANSVARIRGVIMATGTVAAGAFSLGAIGIGQSSAFTYAFQFDATNKRFDLVRVSTNACAAVSGTSGAFTCSGANQIGAAQSLSASGATALSVTLNSETPVDTGGTAFALTQTGGAGGISLTQSGSGERIRGAQSGIAATNSGGGAISINVNGTVTGVADHGISATNDGSGSGITITAVSVSGADSGIRAVEDGSGAVRIAATGTVTGALEEGVYAKTASGGAITLTAAAVTGGKAGIKASAGGSGAVSVSASGAVSATATGGIGIDVSASGGNVSVSAAAVTGSATGIEIAATGTGVVSISASGSVSGGTGDGIFVDHDGTGATTITVTTAVTGGTGANVAAIRTDVSSGRAATVSLNRGASVGTGTRNAIIDTAGNAAVTVNSGATVAGKVNLGAGNDTLTFAGGTFSDVAEMQGGAGTDTLTFRGGSGALHATVQSDGLKGWESVIIESGATLSGNIKLANDSGNLTFNGATLDSSAALDGGGAAANTLSLNNVSDSLDGSKATGWETVSVGAGSTIRFGGGTHGLTAGSLRVTGTLDVGDDSDTGDTLTVSGNFAGGGTVILDANFGSSNSGSDSLRISGNVTGTTTVNLSRIGSGALTTANSATRINGVISVTGANATVTGSAFSLGATGIGQNSTFNYELQFNAAAKRFDLVRVFANACAAATGGSGAFTCSGANQIGAAQSLSASGATALSVTLNSETPVNTAGTAFTLTQTGGGGGISFTQSGSGERIRGAQSGIVAANSGGGAISINVNGTVTGAAGDGISATSDASGSGITVTAAAVSGATSGIKVMAAGAGAVSISASGSVAGGTGDGIFVDHDGTGATSVSVSGSVSGGSGNGVAAIRTDVSSGRAVTVSLNRGASVGAAGRNAIIDTAGNAAVTVNSGATVAGKVNLGAGNDTLAFSGASFSGVTEMDGGAGTDTLRFSGGSGRLHATVLSRGLKGWENVVIQRGATLSGDIKLANDSDNLTFDRSSIAGVVALVADGSNNANTLTFNSVSGSLDGSKATGWETIGVGAGSTIKFGDGAHGLTTGSLRVAGTLDVGDDSDTGDALTVSGNFAGGGSVILDANFSSTSSGSDSLTISGNVTGTTIVNLSRIGAGGITTANSAARINGVISVTGANAAVTGSAFSLGATGIGRSSTFSYRLQFNAPNRRFDLVRVSSNSCEALGGGSGAFICGGANQIGATQSLNAIGATALSVALNSETPVDTVGTAFALTHTGGTGGISMIQLGGGEWIRGAQSGIVATNSGGGAISIDVNATVTGSAGDGISATNDASGAGIAIIAAAVSGSESGIRAVEGGSGAVRIVATGAVTGGRAGISVSAGGAGAVFIRATRPVTSRAHGISVRRSAAGRVDIAVSDNVAGGASATHAAIATDAPSTSAVRIALNSGAAALGAGSSHAIRGGAGDSEVTVAAGARIAGRVSLGSGADTLAFVGGSFRDVTRMDGGAGAGDTLRFGGGSGRLNSAIAGSRGEGLKGWESVIVESGATISGAIKLADDSGNLTFDGADIDRVTALDGGGGSANTLAFNSVSGSLAASGLAGWEDVVIGAGSRVRLTGSRLPRTAAARLSVTGTLAFGNATAATDTFTVQGDFAGGGAVAIDANFAAPENGDPTADMLVIEGSATGTTAIAVNDLTPDDGTVPGDDIEVVTVSGGADASAFTLAGAVIQGSYFWGLAHVPDETGDGVKFVLRPGSGTSDAGAVLRLAPAAIAGGFARSAARMPSAAGSGIGAPMTLTERLGKLIGQDAAGMGGGARSLWARFYSDSQSSDAADGFGESEVDSAGVVIGADLLSREAAGGNWIAGLTMQYGSVSAEAKGAGGTGRQESTGYGFGAAATWFGADGLYANAAAQFGSFEADYSADSTGVIKNGAGGGTSSAVFEVGRRFAASGAMTLVPRGRLGWSSVSSDKFTSDDGVEIDLGTSSVAEASVGVAAEFGLSKGGVRVSGTLSRRLGDPDGVVVGGQTVAQAGPDGWMELGFGGSFDVDANSVLFLDGAYRAGGDSTGLSLSGGLKFNW